METHEDEQKDCNCSEIIDGKNYNVFKEPDIKQRQEYSISRVSPVLSLPKDDASKLICHYKWNDYHLYDEWFNDKERVQKVVGLLDKPSAQLTVSKELTHGIYIGSVALEQIRSALCGHPYCTTCRKGYVTTSINDAPGCLLIRCLKPSCSTIDEDMILDLASDEDKKKYPHCLGRSYVEDKKMGYFKCRALGGDEIGMMKLVRG